MRLDSSTSTSRKGKIVESIELITRSILQVVLAAALAFLVARGVSGCRYLDNPAAKARVVESLKAAYAEGGRAAVSNRIEKLVSSGDLSSKQAAKLHGIAQGVYDHVVEKLEAEIEGTAK